jgi:hypothetical protein
MDKPLLVLLGEKLILSVLRLNTIFAEDPFLWRLENETRQHLNQVPEQMQSLASPTVFTGRGSGDAKVILIRTLLICVYCCSILPQKRVNDTFRLTFKLTRT